MHDLDSDFRVFYRIDGLTSISGPLLCRLAWRVGAYQGVMSSIASAQQERKSKSSVTGQQRRFVGNDEAAAQAGYSNVFVKVRDDDG